MIKKYLWTFCALFAFISSAYATDTSPIDIAFTRFVLDNGLRVIISEDHKAPIVAVHTRYHVGSKNEPEGRRGFAHLFEHLLFQGSEHLDQEFFETKKILGLTSINGTTSYDRTNYFQTVPKQNLDALLWVESDRMGAMVGALTQEKLDNQVSVVLNEMGETKNQPYRGVMFEHFPAATYPAEHPYSWPIIGAEKDLRDATLEDAKQWFNDYYGPNNAALVIVGDVDTQKVIERVRHYYGGIQPGPLKPKVSNWIAKRKGKRKDILHDDVPFTQIHKSWNVPGYGKPSYAQLQLFADLMAEGKSSPLLKTLYFEEGLVSSVYAYISDRELGSQFNIVATLKQDVDPELVSQKIDHLLKEHIKKGFSQTRMQGVKNQNKAALLKGMEKVGGFGGKARALAKNEVQNGGAENFRVVLDDYFSAQSKDIQRAAATWLSDGEYQLVIAPIGLKNVQSDTVDRSAMPALPEQIPAAPFPDIHQETTPKGLTLYHVNRASIPRVQIKLTFHIGRVDDPEDKVGLNYGVFDMLNEGTKKYSDTELAQAFDNLGASFSTSGAMDRSSIFIEANTDNVNKVLDLVGHVIEHASFPEKPWQRIQSSIADHEKKSDSQPNSIASDLLSQMYFGKGHPFAAEQWGKAQDLKKISVSDIKKYWENTVKKQLSTSVVVGDVSLEQARAMTQKLARHFTVAEPSSDKTIVRKATLSKPVIYWTDFPGVSQTVMMSATAFPLVDASADNLSLNLANTMFGRASASRINMNLREDKGWTYGVYSYTQNLRTHRIWGMQTRIQADKTYEGLMELKKESDFLQSPDKTFTLKEINETKRNELLTLTSRWETTDAVARSVAMIASRDYPLDYYQTYADTILSISDDSIRQQAKEHMRLDQSLWMLVGDAKIIEKQLQKIDWADVIQIDSDGQPVKKSK